MHCNKHTEESFGIASGDADIPVRINSDDTARVDSNLCLEMFTTSERQHKSQKGDPTAMYHKHTYFFVSFF